jgi:hypothetical protein
MVAKVKAFFSVHPYLGYGGIAVIVALVVLALV